MPTMRSSGLAALVFLGLVMAPVAALAQDAASLTVTVKDNWGVIPGADARLASAADRTTAHAVTDSAGTATFTVPPATYTLRVSHTGFADHEQAGIVLGAREEKTVTAVLTQPQFSTTVTVTTANRREQLLLDVAEPTTLIDEPQILDTGSRTAKDLLVQQAGTGVQVNAGGGQGHISLNGIPNSGVLVLIDGRRFLGRDANGNFNIEEIQLAGVERVEIVKGPGSALYGADALGGVVNFISRKAKDPGMRNNLSALAGSYSDYRLSDSFSWRNRRAGASVYGSYRTYDGFDLDARNPQTIGQPESKFYSTGLNADVQISDKLIGRLFADYTNRDIDNYFFSGATQLASTVYNSQRELTRYMIAPELEFLPAARTSISASYNYGKYARDETQIFVVGGRIAPQPPWREWNRELKLTARHGWLAFGQEHPLQAGYEHRNEKLRRGSISRTDPERDIDVFWIQQEVKAGAQVKLTGGLRYDDYSDFGDRWSPKASVVFSPVRDGGHRLRASFGEGFRPPYFGELYLRTPPFFVGNPDLLPEETQGWTGGYAYAGAKAEISADYFHTDLKNGITFDLTRQPFTYGNLRKYTSSGVNTSAAVNLPYGFTPTVDYTYNKREDDQGREIGGFPKNATNVKLLWANPRLGLRANIRAEFNGEVPPGVTDTSHQPAYQVWYAQVNKSFARRGSYGLSLWAQVSNIFDERNVYRVNLQGQPLTNEVLQVWIAPRTFQGGITIDMDWR